MASSFWASSFHLVRALTLISFSHQLASFGIAHRERFSTSCRHQCRSETLIHALSDIQAFCQAGNGPHWISRHCEAAFLFGRGRGSDCIPCGWIYLFLLLVWFDASFLSLCLRRCAVTFRVPYCWWVFQGILNASWTTVTPLDWQAYLWWIVSAHVRSQRVQCVDFGSQFQVISQVSSF